MSVYNHRSMVPASHSTRLLDLLDSIRAEFDQLTQEVFICKSQRDEYENKIVLQIKEMTKFQQSLFEMEKTQHTLNKQYEEEIARLRQQLELYTNKQPQTTVKQPQTTVKQEQPPTIGPVSNLFGGPLEFGTQVTSLVDTDPATVPDSFKIEMSDWYALFNPTIKRVLRPNLMHSFDHNSVVCCVKFSLDGRFLAAGCNRVTYIYDVSSGNKICMLQDESSTQEGDLYIRSICFSPDGRFLATGAEDKQIRIWDIASKRIRNVLSGHEQDIYSLDFSRDGRILASGSGDTTTRIWNMAEGGVCMHVLAKTDAGQKDPGVTSVAISHDGRLVATGSLDRMVRVWNAQSGQLMEQLEGHRDSVYSVAFMPGEAELVSGSLDKTVKLWKLGANVNRPANSAPRIPCRMTFIGHKDFVLSLACTYDGKFIISGSKDRSIHVWNPNTGQVQFMLQGHKNSVISVAVTANGRPLFASGSGDNRARIWSY